MSTGDKVLKETSPLSILFVKSGSGGNRMLFRYPFDESFYNVPSLGASHEFTSEQDRLLMRNVIGENDETLCNMFSVNPNLCGHKLEIKVSNVRYVCHPMSLLQTSSTPTQSPASISMVNSICTNTTARTQPIHRVGFCSSLDCLTSSSCHNDIHQSDITSFSIIFALRSSASYDIVDCFHDLSKRLAIALSSQENRCSYLSREIKVIMSALDERDMAALNDQANQVQLIKINQPNPPSHSDQSGDSQQSESVFASILSRSGLAKDLKRIFTSLNTTGIVDLKIDNWIHLSFCLPQKVHRLKLMTHESMPALGTSDIKKCLMYLRPYHGLLLLCEPHELLESLPIDASPAFIQLVKVAKPDKNLMDLSVDANLTLMQIFCIVSQLIYWAKATIIYPICDSNMYAIHPMASIGMQSELVHDFRVRFPDNKPLHHYLAEFSEGTSLSQLNSPLLNVDEKQNLLAIVAWLLQRRVLTQIHKYIFLVIDGDQALTPTTSGHPHYHHHRRHHHHPASNSQPLSALQRAGLSLSSTKSILSIPSSKNPDDLKLLISLMPYFNGRHHVEDIMFFENLERSQVLILCDKFRNILFTCHYEDVAVYQLSPFNKSR